MGGVRYNKKEINCSIPGEFTVMLMIDRKMNAHYSRYEEHNACCQHDYKGYVGKSDIATKLMVTCH